MKNLRPFHLAIPVDCLEKARNFYGSRLGFKEGRSADHWIDYNFLKSNFALGLNFSKENQNVSNLTTSNISPSILFFLYPKFE